MGDSSAVSIKSKERVQQHGEVFTPDSIVNDMLDLVDDELDKEDIKKYIDTTFLEPSCGTGNFLIRILDRKLQAVQRLNEAEQEEWLVHAVSSIYGVDIQWDNVRESKQRMLDLIKSGGINVLDLSTRETEPWHFKKIDLTPEIESILKFILDKNIVNADCLTGHVYNNGVETNQPLLFAKYKWENGKVSVSGSGIHGEFNDDTRDFFENNNKFVDYKSIQELNFVYNDTLESDEEF